MKRNFKTTVCLFLMGVNGRKMGDEIYCSVELCLKRDCTGLNLS